MIFTSLDYCKNQKNGKRYFDFLGCYGMVMAPFKPKESLNVPTRVGFDASDTSSTDIESARSLVTNT